MTELEFKNWFFKLKKIWELKTPEKITEICAEKFSWYETPFDKPYTTKEELLNDWRGILSQDKINVVINLLAVNNNLGIANWNASFERLSSGEKVELNGIFTVKLNNKGKCIEFRQWRSSKK